MVFENQLDLSHLRLKFGLVFLLTVEIWFGLVRLQWRIGLVCFTYGSPCPEIGFGLFYLRFFHRK